RRLSDEGAFEAIAATGEDKAALKARLDRESLLIETERRQLDATNDEIQREDSLVKRAFETLNEKIAKANREQSGWHSKQDQSTDGRRHDRLRQKVDDYNGRVRQFNLDVTEFNRQTGVYNLMSAYPDGLDESATMQPKPSRQ